MSNNTIKPPTLLQSIIPIIVLIGLISCNVLLLGNDTLSGANQLASAPFFFADEEAIFQVLLGHVVETVAFVQLDFFPL